MTALIQDRVVEPLSINQAKPATAPANIMQTTTLTRILSLTAIIGMAATVKADLLYTFPTDATGGDGAAFNGGTFTWSASKQSVQYTGTAGGWNLGGAGPKFEFSWPSQTAMQGLANSGANLSFDLSVDASSFTSGTWADGNWYQLHWAGNSGGATGWTQDGGLTIDTSYNSASPAQSWHVQMTFAQAGYEPGDQWFQLYFGANSDAAHAVQFYVDNIAVTAVPEPSTYVLAGLGLAGWLVLRRRK